MTKAFISYTWDNAKHKKWVHDLAARLRRDGVDVTLDQWHLRPGDQIPVFMARAVRQSDYVLMVCTYNYKKKVDERMGGAGDEAHLIFGEKSATKNERKFIPLLRQSALSRPSELWGKYFIDFSLSSNFEQSYAELLKTLRGEWEEAPEVGHPEPAETDCFVGRDTETEELRSTWEEVKERKKMRFVLVEGFSGVGKTTLVEMFLKQFVVEQFSFFQAKCTETDIRNPLAAFREMFTQEAYSPLNIEAKQEVKFSQFAESLRKQTSELGPLVLFFDDLQWMDESSMSLLQHMKETLQDTPILVVFAYRSREIKLRKRLYTSIQDMMEHARYIQIQGINVDDYVNAVFRRNQIDPNFVRKVQDKTSGNSFIIKRFFHNLRQDNLIYYNQTTKQWLLRTTKVKIPRNAWELIESQTTKFDSRQLHLLKLASVEGEEFTLEIVSTMVKRSPAKIEAELKIFEEAKIIEKIEDDYLQFNQRRILQYRFSHTLYWEYFYEQVQSPADKKQHHHEVAEAIRKFYGKNLELVAGQLSRHYEAADEIELAFKFALMAAEAAHKAYNREDAKNWAEKCLEFISMLGEENVDPVQSCRVAIIYADGQARTPKDLKKNDSLLKKEIDKLSKKSHRKLKCEALTALAYVQYEIGTSHAVETAQRAVQLAEELGHMVLKYEAISILSDILVDNEEDFEEGEKANLEAIRIAEALGDSYRLAGTHAAYAWLLTDLERPEEACENAEQAIRLAEDKDFPDDRNLKAFIYRMAGTAHEANRDFRHALLRYRKALRIYSQLGAKVKVCWMYHDLGDCLSQAHRYPAAIYFFDKCIKQARDLENLDSTLWCFVSLADIDLIEGRVDLAAKRLEDAKKILDNPERRATPEDLDEYHLSLSMLTFLQGDAQSAVQLAEKVMKDAKHPTDRFYANLYLGRYLTKTGPDAKALEQLNKSVELARELKDQIWVALAHELIGDFHVAKNSFPEAVQFYEQAIDLLTGYFHRSGIEKIKQKRDQALTRINKNPDSLEPRANIIALRKKYTTHDGAPTISKVNADIFLKKYFTHCLECNFCKDSCCSYGTDIDIINMQTLMELKEEILPFIRQTDQDWFTPEVKSDSEFPGKQYSRTTVLDKRCIFISKDQRGCGLHRYAIASGKDYHSIKPLVCALFPVTFGNGVLTTSTELEDGSLICTGEGLSAYRGVRQELEHYFGNECIREMDEIEKWTLTQN